MPINKSIIFISFLLVVLIGGLIVFRSAERPVVDEMRITAATSTVSTTSIVTIPKPPVSATTTRVATSTLKTGTTTEGVVEINF